MEDNVLKVKLYVFLVLWFFPYMGFAQDNYSDHRNRQVDSLEQVLATNPPTGAELGRIYRNLMWGYSQTNIEKSMEYARKCIAIFLPIDDRKNLYNKLNVHNTAQLVQNAKALGLV